MLRLLRRWPKSDYQISLYHISVSCIDRPCGQFCAPECLTVTPLADNVLGKHVCKLAHLQVSPLEARIGFDKMHNRLTSHNRLSIAVIILCVTQVLSLAALAVVWMRSNQEPESLVVINYDDPFIAIRADEFDLPQVIMQYDQVIDGIEKFYQDKGYYPPDLEVLVPDYLSKAPGIHIRKGERLTYRPEPMSLYDEVTPFTFNLYGHYPGAAFMHGWYLYYCPSEYDGCNNHGDRHTRQYRINDRWMWINSSAL